MTADEKKEGLEKEEEGGRANGPLPRLLLVEDEPLLSKSLVRLLGNQFEVTVAATAVDAWTALNLGYYDALLVEIAVPGIHGRSFARELLQRIPEIRQRVVMTFGGLAPEERREIERLFDRPVLHKPVSPDLLRRTLSDLLDSTGRRAGMVRGAVPRGSRPGQ